MKRILITGGTGQVGNELKRCPWPEDVEIVMPPRADLDLFDAEAIKAYILTGRFDAVINPAAYTAVDKAESDVIGAFKVNALAPAALAEATRESGIPLVHVSTDYVFDGTGQGAYDEDAPMHPINVYGASKAAGEHAVRLGNPQHVILRTAWVFSPHGGNFVKTMLRLVDRPQLRVVNDQYGCPTAAADIAGTLMSITLRLLDDLQAPTGIYHFVNAGRVTWYDFASAIFAWEAAHGRPVPAVEAIGTWDYPTPARRPANSVLATDKLARDYGIVPRDWSEALDETLIALRPA